MTKTITSQTDPRTRYFLTIDDQTAAAVDCTCPDHKYRGRLCKHMTSFNREVRRALAFNRQKRKFDCRLNGQEYAQYLNYCISLGI